jgi:hypothetical protein
MALTIPRVASWRQHLIYRRQQVAAAVARAKAVTRVARARAGYAAGMAVTTWGIGVIWSLGPALIFGGLVTAWSFLHLYPVDDQ